MKSTIVIVSLLFFIQINLFSQTYIDFSQALHFRNTIVIDSIFEKFEKPNLSPDYCFPKSKLYWQTRHVAVFVSVDTNLRVQHITSYPLFKVNKADKKLWKEMERCIKKASRNWIFKPLYWKIPDVPMEDYKEYVRKANKKKASLPFRGRQSHLIIIQFLNDIYDGDIPFLYQINTP